MKIHDHTGEGRIVRRVLILMITETPFLARIAARWSSDMFGNGWANLLSKWCFKHMEKHHTAPGKSIEDIFALWADRIKNEETRKDLESFLCSLSEQSIYEQSEDINLEHEVDTASQYFNKVRLKNLLEEASRKLVAGEVEEGWSSIQQSTKVDLGPGRFTDLLQDRESVRIAFEGSDMPLMAFQSQQTAPYAALRRFFSNDLDRECFFALLGPEKSTKSSNLRQIAWWAMLDRKRVAYFECGDNTEKQVIRKFMVKASRRPIRAMGNRWPLTVLHPVSIDTSNMMKTQRGKIIPSVEYKKITFKKPLAEQEAWENFQEVMEMEVRSKKSYLRLSCHANKTMNVAGIRTTMNSWEQQGFVADVVICDYADILAPEPGSNKADKRDQINANWQALRTLSQEKHCLVVTATQANAESYRAPYLSREHFGEDKRKMAHVTGMIGLNINADEKEQGLIRWNWIVRREEEFSSSKFLYVAQCLALDQPCVVCDF